jgi:diketogulonate reductase-like aldo/keto reductase
MEIREDLRFFELNTRKIPSVGLGPWRAVLGAVYDAISTSVNVGYCNESKLSERVICL